MTRRVASLRSASYRARSRRGSASGTGGSAFIKYLVLLGRPCGRRLVRSARSRRFRNLEQIGAIFAVLESIGPGEKLGFRGPALPKGDFFKAGNPQPLPPLQGRDEIRRIQHRVAGASVEPGEAAPEALDIKLPPLEVAAVQIRDFQLSPRRRFQPSRKSRRPRVMIIEPDHGQIGFWFRRLLVEIDSMALTIQRDDAEVSRVLNGIAEHGGPGLAAIGIDQMVGKALAIKDVVAQHERAAGTIQEFLADQKRLRQPVRPVLFGVFQASAET